MKRKKEKRTQPVRCPYCGAIADLRPASEIYGDESAAGELYVCRNFPSCESYVRACPGTKQPMGPLGQWGSEASSDRRPSGALIRFGRPG